VAGSGSQYYVRSSAAAIQLNRCLRVAGKRLSVEDFLAGGDLRHRRTAPYDAPETAANSNT
jgi:hypothetical protein